MVIQWHAEDLAARLDALRLLIDTHPDGPVWYWRLRIRILEYLLSRSTAPRRRSRRRRPAGVRFTDPQRAVDPRAEALELEQQQPVPAAHLTARLPFAGTARAPRQADHLRRHLDEIEAAADDRRSPRDPDTAWLWWRGRQVRQSG